MTHQINEAGLNIIKHFEGCSLVPYKDIGGVWTIGYGHTIGVTIDTPEMTQEEADNLLLDDIEGFESKITKFVKVPLTDNQFSALVSLCFNVGIKPLSEGTLGRLLNEGNYAEAASEFLKWNHVGGKVIDGLTKRRAAEMKLFLTED